MRFRSFTIFWAHKYSIHFYICIDLIMLLYTFLVIPFDWCRDKTICLISFNNLSELLPVFTCVRATGNLWSICLGVNILSHVPFFDFYENIPLLKALRSNSLPSYRFIALPKTSFFLLLSLSDLGLILLLKFKIYSIKAACSWLA